MEPNRKNSRQDKQRFSGQAIQQRSIRNPIDGFKSPINAAHISSKLSPTGPFSNAQTQPLSPGTNLSLRSASLSPSHSVKSHSGIDFTALCNPSLYHVLTSVDIPPPFRNIVSHSDPSLSLQELISAGHFRDAAIKAAQMLTVTGQSLSNEHIFDLFYKRLACLTLCNQITLAVQEVKALEDLNNAQYRDEKTGKHLVPWELRVLAVRLQGLGFGDVRRGVIGFYDLVSEARLALTNLKKERNLDKASDEEIEKLNSEIIQWEQRLSDLGLRVASALIEMEDFEGASRFLSTLKLSPLNPNLQHQKALLWLYLGDIDEARICAGEDQAVITLAYIADGQFEDAVKGWEGLIESGDPMQKAMWKQNLAVSLIYLGRIDEARKILEKLIDEEGYGFHALTFNLSTIYELCTERSRSLKIGLAQRLAEVIENSKTQGLQGMRVGWDKVNGDFKL